MADPATTDANPEHGDTTPAEAPEPERHAGALVTRSRGQEVLHVSREDLVETVTTLKDEGFVMCSDVTSADYLERPVRDVPTDIALERFELIVNLVSMEPPARIRLRVQIPESDPTVPSLFELFPGTEAMEREVYDLMGICFAGHPDLTRILLPEGWEGHPLRKDYAMGRIPVQFKSAPATR
ncbi:MAG: hypothetical protein NVSMB4_20650 [Acidimicrobiales bacterium]